MNGFNLAVFLASFFFGLCVWLFISLKKARKELSAFRLQLAQPTKLYAVSLGPMQKLTADIRVPSDTPSEFVEIALAGKLARSLPGFWTMKKSEDYLDVFASFDLYQATIYVQKPIEEVR